MHEVHRPHLVDRFGYSERLGLLAHQALLRFDPQVQLQLPVDAVDALVVPAKALHVAQIQEAQAKAPVAIGRGQAHQPVGDQGVLVRGLRLVAIARLTDLKRAARVPDVRSSACNRLSGHLPA